MIISLVEGTEVAIAIEESELLDVELSKMPQNMESGEMPSVIEEELEKELPHKKDNSAIELPVFFGDEDDGIPSAIEKNNELTLEEKMKITDALNYEICDDKLREMPKKIIEEQIDGQAEDGYNAKELTIKEKQDLADKVAQDYNAKTNPYQRALNKGVEGVKETLNGGVSFAETDNIYFKDDGTKCIVKIQATGNRTKDFDAANKAMDLEETPDGYVWHHIDDYNVEDGTITLELVEDEVHNASKPHSGGCAQYDAVNGPSYNPPRKGDMWNV